MREVTPTSLTPVRHASSSRPRPPVPFDPQLASWYTPGPSDALGDRLLLCDNTDGDALEMLRLRAHLTMHPTFEARLRAQAQILKSFESPAFAAIHSVERLEDTENALAIVSSHVPGIRLSDVLKRGAHGRRPLSVDAALYIVRQLVEALAALHSHASGLTHGALSPERVVLTARGTVIVIEHALGAALADLRYDQHRFWRELGLGRIASDADERTGSRTDVLQIGLIALSAILGRNLTIGDFPNRIEALLSEAAVILNAQRLYPPAAVSSWMRRALQRDPTTAFRSALEAADALPEWSGEEPHVRIARVRPTSAPPATRPPTEARVDRNHAGAVIATQPAPPPAAARRLALRRVLASITGHLRLNRIWISISAIVAGVAVALALVGIPTAPVLGNSLSTLVVTSVPSAAAVRINGHAIGITPTRHMLEPGTYELELSRDGEIRRFTVAMRRNVQLNQHVDMAGVPRGDRSPANSAPLPTTIPLLPASAARSESTDESATRIAGATAPLATLVVSAPLEFEVFHDGRRLGVSGSDEIPVPTGRLAIELVNRELGFRTSTAIAIQPGRQHMLAVTLPQGVLNVNAQPWAEVSIDGRRAGETPLGNIPIEIGHHRISFRHPDLGTVTRDVLIKVPGETLVTVDLRR